MKRAIVMVLLLCGCAAEQAAVRTENAVTGLAHGLKASTALVATSLAETATSVAKTFDGLTALTSEAQATVKALRVDAVAGGRELLLLVAATIVAVVILSAWRIHAKVGRVHRAVLDVTERGGP